MSIADRRDSYRITLEPGHGKIVLADGLALELCDLSGSGASVHLGQADLERLGRGPCVIDVDGSRLETEVEAVRAMQVDTNVVRAGLRFLSNDSNRFRNLAIHLTKAHLWRTQRLSRLQAPGEPQLTTNDPKFIRGLLELHCVQGHRALRVYCGDHLTPMAVKIPAVKDLDGVPHAVLMPVGSGDERFGGDLPYTLALPSGAAIYFFEVKPFRLPDGSFVSPLPPAMHQTGFRDSIRAAVPPGMQVSVGFPHPRFRDVAIRRPVLDFAGRGFSFSTRPDEDILFPGTRVGEFAVSLPVGEVRGVGIIRNITPLGEEKLWSCGMEIQRFHGPTHAERWHDFVLHTAHPHIRLKDENAAGQAWTVLRTSDYVDLWTPRRRRPYIARRFGDAWFSMPDRFGHLLLLNDGTRTIGTVAANMLYPRTWIFHHLGIDKEERSVEQKRQFLRFMKELYSAGMYTIQHMASADNFVIYVEKTKRWTDFMYGYFVTRYSQSTDFVYGDLMVAKCDLELAPRPPRDFLPPVSVVSGGEVLTKTLVAHLAKTKAPLEIDAFAYDEKEITLESFSRSCLSQGYERTRELFFAVDQGEPVAAMIAESGGEGVNIFGLLNSCRIIDMKPGSPKLKLARTHLLYRAIEYYRLLEKKEFIFYNDAPDLTDGELAPLGFNAIQPGVRWLVRREVVPAWLSYVDDLLSLYG